MQLDYGDISELADSGAYGGDRTLSGASCAFLLSAIAAFTENAFQWVDATENWDDIQALTALATDEIMASVELGEGVVIGAVLAFAGDTLPDNYLWCDGSDYERVDYPDLYAALDGAFIVDCDNFSVPDLQGRVPVGVGAGSELTERSPGDTGGEETHGLTVDELPEHSHGVPRVDNTQPASVDLYRLTYHSTRWKQSNTFLTGGNQSHENMPPFVSLRYMICAANE